MRKSHTLQLNMSIVNSPKISGTKTNKQKFRYVGREGARGGDGGGEGRREQGGPKSDGKGSDGCLHGPRDRSFLHQYSVHLAAATGQQ